MVFNAAYRDDENDADAESGLSKRNTVRSRDHWSSSCPPILFLALTRDRSLQGMAFTYLGNEHTL